MLLVDPLQRPWHFTELSKPVLALLCLAAGVLVALLWVPVKDYWTRSKLPSPACSSWLLGHLQMLRSNSHRFMRQSAKQVGGIYHMRIVHQQVVVVVDAKSINTVLGANQSLSKALEPISDKLLAQRSGHPTLFSAGTKTHWWKTVRKGTAPAFVQANVRHGIQDVMMIMDRVCEQLNLVDTDEAVDVNNITLRISMDVTGIVGFAKDFRTTCSFHDEKTNATIENLKSAMLELFRQGVNPVRFLNIFDKDVRAGRQQMRMFQREMRELVAEVKARGPPPESDVSIAAHLLRLTDPSTGKPMEDDLLASEFGVYFAAGIESAGNAMTWTMYLISQHPEVEKKLVEELDKNGFLATAGQPKPVRMQYSDLSKLTYLSWVCKEAMRLRPVASTGVTRRADKELHLLGYTIPAGTIMLCPFDAAHRWEGNWPDRPDDFVPERWAEPQAELVAGVQGSPDKLGHQDKVRRFLAFSTGPRQCIGQSLARMLHDVGIAMLYGQYSFQLAPKMGGPEGVDRGEINRLTLQPGDGMWMIPKPRVAKSALKMAEE